MDFFSANTTAYKKLGHVAKSTNRSIDGNKHERDCHLRALVLDGTRRSGAVTKINQMRFYNFSTKSH